MSSQKVNHTVVVPATRAVHSNELLCLCYAPILLIQEREARWYLRGCGAAGQMGSPPSVRVGLLEPLWILQEKCKVKNLPFSSFKC